MGVCPGNFGEYRRVDHSQRVVAKHLTIGVHHPAHRSGCTDVLGIRRRGSQPVIECCIRVESGEWRTTGVDGDVFDDRPEAWLSAEAPHATGSVAESLKVPAVRQHVLIDDRMNGRILRCQPQCAA